MTLASAFQDLWVSLHELRDALQALRLALAEDRPAGVEVQPLRARTDAIDDLLGLLHEALAEVAKGLQGTRAADVAGAPQTLASAHGRVNALGARWSHHVASYERLEQLATVGGERGGEWAAWSASVIDSVDRFADPLWAVHHDLLQCWQDLIEGNAPAAATAADARGATTEEG